MPETLPRSPTPPAVCPSTSWLRFLRPSGDGGGAIEALVDHWGWDATTDAEAIYVGVPTGDEATAVGLLVPAAEADGAALDVGWRVITP